jgi:hypothetical protein
MVIIFLVKIGLILAMRNILLLASKYVDNRQQQGNMSYISSMPLSLQPANTILMHNSEKRVLQAILMLIFYEPL